MKQQFHLLVVGAFSIVTAAAQTLSFDVISVRQNTSREPRTGIGFQQPSGRFRAVNEPLWRLIAEAYRTTYQLRRFEIVGIPGSIDSDQFDIEAVPPPGDHSVEQLHEMLKNLLESRFKLAVHRETRQLPVYHLVMARSDGRLGARLQTSAIDCAALRAAGGPIPAPLPGQPKPCTMVFGEGYLGSDGMSITNLAETGLSRAVERVVVDRTGLKGGYQWTLEWAEDRPGQPAAQDGRVSLFTALQEQLGLKLEAAVGPVEVLVVDYVERPMDN